MKLEKKKALVSRALNIGKNRIRFNEKRLSEFKEAITKQDIKDLFNSGAFTIKDIKGRKKIVRRTNRRRAGSIRKKPKRTKAEYIILTRKLRFHLKTLKEKDKITNEDFINIRKKIKAGIFRNLAHLKESMTQEKKTK